MKVSAFYENILEGAGNDELEIRKALAQLKEDGMETVYISYDTLRNDAEENTAKMLRELGLGMEGIYGFFRFEKDPLDDSYRDMIDRAVKMNAGNVLLVPGFILEADRERRGQLLENMWTGLKNAVQYGNERGTAVSIEDFDGLDAPYCCIKGVAEFLENVPGLQLSFDTGNFVMYHEDELEALELFRDKICTVHMKDRGRVDAPAGGKDSPRGTDQKKEESEQPVIVCADGEKVCTVPVGSGFIHMKEILSGLRNHGYDGGLIAEMYGHSAENMYSGLRESVRWIRETWDALPS